MNPVSLSAFAAQQLFDSFSEPTIYIGIYERVNGWIARHQKDGNYVSCIAKIMLGAEVDYRIDDKVWSPAQSVDDTNRYNHFGDAFTDANDTLSIANKTMLNCISEKET